MPSRSFYALAKFGLAVLTDEFVSIAKPKMEGVASPGHTASQQLRILETDEWLSSRRGIFAGSCLQHKNGNLYQRGIIIGDNFSPAATFSLSLPELTDIREN